jgi:hypothetical protein
MPCRRFVLDDVEEEENLLDFICVTIMRNWFIANNWVRNWLLHLGSMTLI